MALTPSQQGKTLADVQQIPVGASLKQQDFWKGKSNYGLKHAAWNIPPDSDFDLSALI